MRMSPAMLAHVAGAPLEETVLSLMPMVLTAAGMTVVRLRGIAAERGRSRSQRRRQRSAPARQP